MSTERRSNVCGILSVCLFVNLPVPAAILGIVALARREETTAYGVVGLVLSALMVIASLLNLATMVGAEL